MPINDQLVRIVARSALREEKQRLDWSDFLGRGPSGLLSLFRICHLDTLLPGALLFGLQCTLQGGGGDLWQHRR